MKIVSLPSATEIVFALGLGDALEGVTFECDHPPEARSKAVVCTIRLDLSLRGTLAMWSSAVPNLFCHLPDDDELLAGIPLVDRPYTQPVSFSVWTSRESAMAFAHGRSGHPDAVARVRRSQASLMGRYSSAMFSPYRSQGTWHDRDPLAQSLTDCDEPRADKPT